MYILLKQHNCIFYSYLHIRYFSIITLTVTFEIVRYWYFTGLHGLIIEPYRRGLFEQMCPSSELWPQSHFMTFGQQIGPHLVCQNVRGWWFCPRSAHYYPVQVYIMHTKKYIIGWDSNTQKSQPFTDEKASPDSHNLYSLWFRTWFLLGDLLELSCGSYATTIIRHHQRESVWT